MQIGAGCTRQPYSVLLAVAAKPWHGSNLHSLERRQLQLPPRRAGVTRQRQVLRGVLQTTMGDFWVELSYTREVQLIV